MPAMVMKFKVAEPALMEGVERGMVVRFDLERRGTELRILKLEILDASTGGVGMGQDFEDEPAPDFELVDQDITL